MSDENGDDSDFWSFIGISPLRKLVNKEELYYRYGKSHWCFKPNFDTLSPKQKVDCKKYYEIKPKEIRDIHPYASAGAAFAAANAKAGKK